MSPRALRTLPRMKHTKNTKTHPSFQAVCDYADKHGLTVQVHAARKGQPARFIELALTNANNKAEWREPIADDDIMAAAVRLHGRL
jgi:hypothetical protein